VVEGGGAEAGADCSVKGQGDDQTTVGGEAGDSE